jgi:hypothetical protein
LCPFGRIERRSLPAVASVAQTLQFRTRPGTGPTHLSRHAVGRSLISCPASRTVVLGGFRLEWGSRRRGGVDAGGWLRGGGCYRALGKIVRADAERYGGTADHSATPSWRMCDAVL